MVPPSRNNVRDIFVECRQVNAILDQAEVTVLDADDLDAGVQGILGDGANDGVEPRAVAAAGEQADALEHVRLSSFPGSA